jgi:hypothetical protein
MIRIGAAAWRVAPRPQRVVIRRPAIATPRADDETPPDTRAPKSEDSATIRR